MSSPPIIILVRPQLGENIGKAARAMLNFGLTEMRLVAPRDGWPNPTAGPAASGADIVLAGHDHHYERFAPMNVNRTLNYRDGLRSWVGGTGGQNLFSPAEYKWTPGSEKFLAEFGVLRLTLYEFGYRWAFVNTRGETSDSGFDTCHGKPKVPVTKPPPPPKPAPLPDPAPVPDTEP